MIGSEEAPIADGNPWQFRGGFAVNVVCDLQRLVMLLNLAENHVMLK